MKKMWKLEPELAARAGEQQGSSELLTLRSPPVAVSEPSPEVVRKQGRKRQGSQSSFQATFTTSEPSTGSKGSAATFAQALTICLWGLFARNQGRKCTSPSRVIEMPSISMVWCNTFISRVP